MQAEKLQPDKQEKMQRWAEQLKDRGLHQVAATLLEAAGPLNIVGAQLVYLSQPVLNGFLDDRSLSSLAWMLEEPAQTKSFIQTLREDAR
ncbi:MAG TPA: hypothetical protein VJ965_08080 [Anaerolineales bacterium]|nr:hypothetical protein [Anaerolineales bacterium]